jgi:outer membrane lipoprotein-sorting protein
MQDMRLWLDARRIAPSRFTSTEAGGYLVVRTEFQVDAEAEAFADSFAGRMASN